MPGRVIDFELATNPTKLWRASRKPKEARNVVKSTQGYFLLLVRVRLLVVSWCMRLPGLCLQSPAGVRKEDSERNEACRRPYYCRKCGRSGVIVLLLVLLAFAVTAAEGSQDDHVKMPPPPGGSMRQQLSEQDLLSIRRYNFLSTTSYMDDTIKHLETLARKRREGAKRCREEAKEMDEEADELQERVKVLRQTQQGRAKQDQPEEGESPGEAHGPDTTQKLKLKFNGSLSDTIHIQKSLLGYSKGGPIEIEICRGDQTITSGDLSSLEVEIVALKKGHTCKHDWTEEDFDHQIIRSGQGLNVLDGKTIVQLHLGKASLPDNIHFKEGSHQTGVHSFILAARVSRSTNIIGTARVEEAFMDNHPFRVLTERSIANKKFDIPTLYGDVYCLKGIKRKGDYHERLKNAGINTVQQFLKAFNETPERLQRQTLNINSENNKSWRDMVEHAKECDLRNDHRLKSWTWQVQKREVTLFFNVVHDLVGAEFSGRFVAKDKFTVEEEVGVNNLVKLAYQELNDTFDHIMKDGHPVNVHASINAAGSQSVPISAAENLGSTSGINCADGPLPGTVGQSAPEPSRSGHRNEIAKQAAENSGSALEIDCPDGPLAGTAGQSAPEPSRSDHRNEIAKQAAENSGSASGIDCADGPLPRTAGQGAPKPSHSDHRNEIAKQGAGQNHTPEGGLDGDASAFSVSDVPEVEVVNGTDRVYIIDTDQQGDYELLLSVRESDKSNPAVDRSSGGNFDLSTDPFGQDQAAGNSASASGNDRAPDAIFGDANRNAARYRAPEPSPDHQATFRAAAPGPQSQSSKALGFASTWNPFEDQHGQGTTFATAYDQSQPSTALGFASTRNLFEEPPVQGTTFAAAPDQSQPNTAPSFASSWNPFEDPPGQGQGTTFAAHDQSQPSTAPGFASTRNLLEEPPLQGTTFLAAPDQSQPNNAPSFASSWNPFEDPPGQDPGFDYNGSSHQY